MTAAVKNAVSWALLALFILAFVLFIALTPTQAETYPSWIDEELATAEYVLKTGDSYAQAQAQARINQLKGMMN
jgi:hypothetical protein